MDILKVNVNESNDIRLIFNDRNYQITDKELSNDIGWEELYIFLNDIENSSDGKLLEIDEFNFNNKSKGYQLYYNTFAHFVKRINQKNRN